MRYRGQSSGDAAGDRPVVLIVDDDPAVRRGVELLLRALQFECEVFARAQDFLAYERPPVPACLVLDIRMPGMSGLDLQRTLSTRVVTPPIVFISGYADVEMCVQAMRAGAVDVLLKPFDDERLLMAVQRAIERDRLTRERQLRLAEIRESMASLTPRENDVFALVTTGLTNREIAERIGTTEKTVKVHRGRVMRKMNARSLAELVRIAIQVSGDADPGGPPPG